MAQNAQIVHSRLVEQLRPDNPLTQRPYLVPPFSLATAAGVAALNAEAAMVAYVDDFKLMMIVIITAPLLLLRRPV